MKGRGWELVKGKKGQSPGVSGAFVYLGMTRLTGETLPQRLSIQIRGEAQGPSPANRDGRGRRGIRDERAMAQIFFTAWACGPLGPWVTSNSTWSPSFRDLNPEAAMAE